MTHELFRLDGRTALVTGGEQGLGQAIAVALAGAGADVAFTVYTGDGAATLARISALGRRGLPLRVDLGRPGAAEQVLAEAIDDFGVCDILVNNAGMIRRASAVETADEEWEQVLRVNLDAVWGLCRGAARVMIPRGRGKIINIASLLSFQGGVRVPAYTASKHAVAGLTKALANEWAPLGLNVNAIAPGYMATANTEALRADPERSRQILERIPAGRWGSPEDLAGAAVFLAAPASDYINGHILVVDGGWLAR